jgi:hypothetical protein
MMPCTPSDEAKRWLADMQEAAYQSFFDRSAPVYSVAEYNRLKEVAARELSDDGDFIKKFREAAGSDLAAKAWHEAKIRQFGKDNDARQDEMILAASDDIPTAHVAFEHHAVLRRIRDRIHRLADTHSDYFFGQWLHDYRSQITVSTLPLGQFNARTKPCPLSSDIFVLFDPAMLAYISEMSEVIASMINLQQLERENASYIATGRPGLLGGIVGAHHQAADAMFREMLITFYSKGFPSIQASPKTFQRRFAVTLRETAALFVAAHEYGHIYHGHVNRGKGVPGDSCHPDPGAAGWDQELEADAFAITIVELVLASQLNMVPQVRFIGVDFFFVICQLMQASFSVLESGKAISASNIFVDQHEEDSPHPSAVIRMAHAHQLIEDRYSLTTIRGAKFNQAVLLQAAMFLWAKAQLALINMHRTGVNPASTWGGFDALGELILQKQSGQLWAGVVSLVSRPLRSRKEPSDELPAAKSGEPEMTALQGSPGSQAKAVALAEVLLARVAGDPGFKQGLRSGGSWPPRFGKDRERHQHDLGRQSGRSGTAGQRLHRPDVRRLPGRACDQVGRPGRRPMTSEGSGETSNTISDSSLYGPVLQGRDFSNVTINLGQAAAAPVALAYLPPLAAGFTGRETELAQVAELLDPGQARGRWRCRRWRGWPGWARRLWRCTPRTPPGRRAGFRAGCCSSTCTATTRGRCGPAPRWTRCSGHWASRGRISRRGPSSAQGCTGRRWRTSGNRC